MSLKCRVFRDEKGQIDFVNAENGNRSKLFDKLVDITGGNKNTALNIYALTEVDELKEAMGAKLNALKERFKNIVKVAPETSPMAGEVMFSKTATKPTYFSNAIGAINNLADKNPKNTQGWLKQLTDTQKNGGIKNVNQELEWIGLEDYLTSYVKENSPKAGNIPASVVEDYIKANQIEIVDISKSNEYEEDITDIGNNTFVIKGTPIKIVYDDGTYNIYDGESKIAFRTSFGDSKDVALRRATTEYNYTLKPPKAFNSNTKYEGYQLKGGENYREVLLTMPNKEGKNPLHTKRDQLSKQYREAFDSGNYDLANEIDNQISDITKQLIAENSLNTTGEEAQYKSSHWDEANILAHVRINEKTLPDGRRVLIVNELQSDWAQDGRKKGFIDKKKVAEREVLRLKLQAEKDKVRTIEAKLSKLQPLTKEEEFELNQQRLKLEEARYNVRNNREWDALGEEINKIEEQLNNYENTKNRLKNDRYEINYIQENSISKLEEDLDKFDNNNKYTLGDVGQMPYKNTDQWLGLATRRVLQMAAQEGYDGVSFATGQQSADMYSLSNQVDKIDIEVVGEKRAVGIFQKNNRKDTVVINKEGVITSATSDVYKDKRAEDVLGKDLTKKILGTTRDTTLEGEGLEFGGEGMKTFYNSILPKVAQKEAQRFDKNTKLGSVDFGDGDLKVINASKDSDFPDFIWVNSYGEKVSDGFSSEEQALKNKPKIATDKLSLAEQPFIAITDKMRSELGKAIPMFSKNQGQEAPREVIDQVTDRLKQSGLANNVYQMSNSEIEAKLIELGVSPEIIKQVDINKPLILEKNERVSWSKNGKTYKVGDIIDGNKLDELSGDLVGNFPNEKFVLVQTPLSEFTDTREELLSLEEGYEEEEIDRLESMKDNFNETPPIPSEGDGMHRIISAKELGYKTILMWKNVKDTYYFDPTLNKKDISLNTAGFTYQGDVYLNTDVMGLDTPIHEFGHLHLDWLKENRTDLYQAGLSLIGKNKEEAQQYIDIVKETQPDLKEGTEKFNNEVLAQVIGDQGAKLVNSKKEGSIAEWLRNVWEAIKDILGLSNYTAEQVANMTLAEFGTASAAEMLSGRVIKDGLDFSTFSPNKVISGVNQDLVNLSEQYKKENNLPLELPRLVISLSEKDAMRVADAYDEMKHDPNNPAVELAYKSLITEIKKQADLLLNAGYKFELSTKERGYNSSSEMIKDVKDNKHIFIDPSSENFGTTREFNEDNIGLADSGYKDINGNPLTNVEVIRAVHDVFGHAKFGTQFGAIGEENAWRVHMSMFSPEAQKALTATTRGQNSWVNFGGHMRKDGKVLKKGDEGYMSPTERPFAEQKIGILPDWATDNSYGDTITINGESITPVNKYSILGEDIYEISDGKAYYDAILSAKNSRLGTDIPEDVRDGIQVYVKSAKEYQDIIDKGGKLLVSKDGLTGVMVEADGNIGSGFNHSSNNKPNSLAPYLIVGIKMGARYTDAYDTYLPKYYAKFGFVASERMKFDETYAEEGWDKSILKTKPDVVFMYFDGGDRMTIEDRVGTFEPYKKTDGDYIEDYDQGVENTKNKTSEKSSLIPLVSKPEAYDVNYSMVTPTSKNISPENSSNYANLTEDGEGNFVFYHVGKSGYDVIKRTSGDTINTSREEAQALVKVGGLAMYYSKPEDGETMITGESKYMVKIPINKVYDFNTDSLNLTEKAKELHSKEHPGKSFDANTQVAYVTKVAADFGYDMVVAEWQNRTRAQSIKEHKPNDTQISEGATIKKPFQENYESNSSKGFKSVIPVTKKEQLKQLYLDLNNYRNRENRYDDIYSLYEEYSKLSQEEIKKRIENSDIPQEYKSKYESIVSSEEGKRMSISPVQKSVIRQPSLELNGTKIFAKDRMNPITGEKLDGIEWELIESTERGQGNARKAAELFLNGTDAQGKDVYLMVSPRDTATKPERLESFYSSLGFEKTSDFEMVRKARPVSLKDTDSNGEPSIKTLMDFSNSKVKPLGLEGLKAAKNSAMALKVKSSKELVEKMEKALMKNGIVLFDKLSLQRSKLYNNFEINTILSSPKLQKEIKESLLSLRNSEPFEIEYDENFIVPQGREVNQFGKQDVINPNLVENELMQSVAGLEESEIDEALPDNLSNRYYTDSNFKETVDAIARDYKKAPIKTVVDGELIDKTEDVEGMLLNTLTEGLDDLITRDVAFLRGEIDEEIFSSNLTRVSKVLNMIKKNAYINGIDLRNLPTLALELSRSEILGFLDSMEDAIKDPSNPENFMEFTERYYKILGDKELKTEVIKSNSQNDVIVEEPLSEYEMFSKFGLVKKDDGIYRKVQEQSLDSLYESFFEYKNLLPEGIESIEALKVYVQKNASLLEVSDYEVDVDNLEKIFLYKKFFDFPMSTQSPRVNTENFNKITNPEDYLTDDFVKDFNKWLLTTANPYFKVTSKGIELVNKDELSKTEAVNSVPERFKQELAEYNIISDNLNLDMPLLEEKYEDINTQLEQRQKAVNNPDRVKKVSGQYTYLKDGVLAAKNESETFVKTPIGIFEKIFEFENVKFYGKLDTSKNQGYKKVSIEAPFSDINFKDYMYLASSPEAFKTSKNYYSKKELDDINEEYFGCQ